MCVSLASLSMNSLLLPLLHNHIASMSTPFPPPLPEFFWEGGGSDAPALENKNEKGAISHEKWFPSFHTVRFFRFFEDIVAVRVDRRCK